MKIKSEQEKHDPDEIVREPAYELFDYISGSAHVALL
jgi:hypothetical protein